LKTALIGEKRSVGMPGRGGGLPYGMDGDARRLLRGVNFGFWSRSGCSGQNVIIFSRQGLVEGCTQRDNKTERILIL